jgi:hypothetical protein
MPQHRAQGKRPCELRVSEPISRKLDKNLLAYVATAGATGVGLLASPPAAEAKIVYTPANTRLYENSFPVDLNNDGVADITLSAHFQVYSFYRTILSVIPGAGNAVVSVATGAADLPWGARIGPKENFNPARQLMASAARCGSSYCDAGPWGGPGNPTGYLGIRFLIHGETHYGWARLTAHRLPATLTGYAYETIPNKPIIAGKVSGPVSVRAVNPSELLTPSPFTAPSTLDLLARGADGIAIWRREEESVSE